MLAKDYGVDQKQILTKT